MQTAPSPSWTNLDALVVDLSWLLAHTLLVVFCLKYYLILKIGVVFYCRLSLYFNVCPPFRQLIRLCLSPFYSNFFAPVDSLSLFPGKTEIENILQTKYGCLKVADLIGKKFGTKVRVSK